MKKISVIVPVYNDKSALSTLLRHMAASDQKDNFEIIVVDAGSDPSIPLTDKNIRQYRSPVACRAVQMNIGADLANFDILYFVHADALPPHSFVKDINNAIDHQCYVGGYRLKFVSGPVLLRINSYITRFLTPFSGGGDQSLFITRQIFMEVNGFDERYAIMEDFELVKRLRPKYGYHIIHEDIEVSSRKYRYNSYLKVNWANLKAFWHFYSGTDPNEIQQMYEGWLKNN